MESEIHFSRKVFKYTLKALSVWSNIFCYVKICIFWKSIQCTVHWDKTQMFKNFFRQNKQYKKCPLFSFASSNASLFTFNLWFSYSYMILMWFLKHKEYLSKKICGVSHFCFCFVLDFCLTKSNAPFDLKSYLYLKLK